MTVFVQLLLAVVITTLTLLVSIIGIQVFHLLHELRAALKKVNRVLDNTETLSETVARPVTAVNSFFSEVKDLVNTTQDKLIEETPDKVIPQVTHREKLHHRFFRRSGLPLRST